MNDDRGVQPYHGILKGENMLRRDEFYWLTRINEATILINSSQGLVSPEIAKKAAAATRAVLAEGEADAAKRAKTYITYEPLLTAKAGPEITIIHAGRSSQDIHATYRAAILRDKALEAGAALNTVMRTMEGIARDKTGVVVPAYTNGVAAQPTRYSHYLLGILAGFRRDFTRLKEFYARLNLCPMGSTVLNGTCWPLNRAAMAAKLGFGGVADNAFDATQISQSDLPLEFSSILTSVAVHITSFLEDLMVQYAQPRPWIILQEGGENTYVSSAMPQKRNPGLVNNCRTEASTVIGEAQAELFRAHNLQTGMIDPKKQNLNAALADRAVSMLGMFNRVLKALVINPERALEELNSDWTASQEVADVLMKEFGVPFRIGHHAASGMVSFARKNAILPRDFPYSELQRIYREVIEKEYPDADPVLPMSEERFRKALDPVSIVNNRATQGGPQLKEVERMLALISEFNAESAAWLAEREEQINGALAALDQEFSTL
jgi:argininosuccinate lyase